MTTAELNALAKAKHRHACEQWDLTAGKSPMPKLEYHYLLDALIEAQPGDVRERMAEKLREGMRAERDKVEALQRSHEEGDCASAESTIEQLDEALCSLLHRGDELGTHSPATHLDLYHERGAHRLSTVTEADMAVLRAMRLVAEEKLECSVALDDPDDWTVVPARSELARRESVRGKGEGRHALSNTASVRQAG